MENNMQKHYEAVESYINGNISTFRDYARRLDPLDVLELIEAWEFYALDRKELKRILSN